MSANEEKKDNTNFQPLVTNLLIFDQFPPKLT